MYAADFSPWQCTRAILVRRSISAKVRRKTAGTMVSSSVVVNPSLYEKVPYDVYKSLAPVTLAGSSPNILVVHPSVPAKTVKELIAYIQANPGKVSFASPGFGTTASLAAENFKYALKLDIQPVPFNGAGPALNAVVAGQVPIAFMCIKVPSR